MSATNPSLWQTLEFRTAASVARLLLTGLLLIFFGLALSVLADADSKPSATIFGAALCLIAGGAATILALWRRSHAGKPYFTLSPAGVRYRIFAVKEFLVPWSAVKGVETINIDLDLPWYVWLFTPLHSYNAIYCSDVTVLLISKQFYDETMSTGTVALGDATKPLSSWQWAQIAILLVGIGATLANIAGFWQLPGQSEARVARMKAREESNHWKQMLKQSEQESREREAQSKQREKEMDEMMKRTFGD